MFASNFFRVSAVLLILGGILGIAGTVLSPYTPPEEAVGDPLFMPSNLMMMLSGLMVVVGLPAVYARIARPGGVLALLGLVALMFTVVMLSFFTGAVSAVLLPWVVDMQVPAAALNEGPAAFGIYFMTASLLALIGAVAFGLAIVRSRRISRWPGYILLVAGVVNLVAFALPEETPAPVWMIAPSLFNLAFAWMGVEVWRAAEDVGDTGATRREDLVA
jgi:hypothetical protein